MRNLFSIIFFILFMASSFKTEAFPPTIKGCWTKISKMFSYWSTPKIPKGFDLILHEGSFAVFHHPISQELVYVKPPLASSPIWHQLINKAATSGDICYQPDQLSRK